MRCALTFGAGNGIIFESSENPAGAAHRSEALFFKSGICAFSRRSRRRISPLPESDKRPKPDGKPERVCALRPAGLARAAAMRGPLDSRRPCTTLVPQERQQRRPLRGIFEAVCLLPRPEPRPRLGASAGQGASAEILSRRMSYHVHTYIRSREGRFIARPRAYALTARCLLPICCSDALLRAYAYTLTDEADPLPKLLMLNCASARISCIDFDCSARRASQNEAKALCCARAHIRPDADGPPDRGSKSTVPPESRPAFRLIVNTAEKPCAFVRGSPAHAGRIGGAGAFFRRAAFERAVCRIRAKNRFRLIFTFLFPARRIRDKACFPQKGGGAQPHLRTGALPALLYGCTAFLRRAARRTAGAFRRLGRRTPAAAFHKRITISARE